MIYYSPILNMYLMEMKGSKTEKNILAAFAGESQARTRYTFFASVAKKEGYEQIAAIFLESADNEKEHAKLFFRLLPGGEAEIKVSYPAGRIGITAENLKAAADGEQHEWGTLYPEGAEIAEKEGFLEAARTFREIAKVEVYHEKRYRQLLSRIEQGTVFTRAEQIRWKCRNCGYVHNNNAAPDQCPVCAHPMAYFELWCDNY
jgi:rubrerythrin